MATKIKARRLSVIADAINATSAKTGYGAKVTKGFCNTDRQIPGTRLRDPGKGREGNRIIIYAEEHGENIVVFDHNSAETYRNNGEVEKWVYDHIKSAAHPGINEDNKYDI